jgi:hypothetical protein
LCLKTFMSERVFKNIADILFKDTGCTGESDHAKQISRLLFPKHLDALEKDKVGPKPCSTAATAASSRTRPAAVYGGLPLRHLMAGLTATRNGVLLDGCLMNVVILAIQAVECQAERGCPRE